MQDRRRRPAQRVEWEPAVQKAEVPSPASLNATNCASIATSTSVATEATPIDLALHTITNSCSFAIRAWYCTSDLNQRDGGTCAIAPTRSAGYLQSVTLRPGQTSSQLDALRGRPPAGQFRVVACKLPFAPRPQLSWREVGRPDYRHMRGSVASAGRLHRCDSAELRNEFRLPAHT